jgi:hypothetical protein
MTCASLIVSRFMLVLCLALCSPKLTLAQTGKAAITALMPQPRSINYGGGWLPVKGGFRVEWLGVGNSVAGPGRVAVSERRRTTNRS